MAPTAFLMGCHINHFEEIAAVSRSAKFNVLHERSLVFYLFSLILLVTSFWNELIKKKHWHKLVSSWFLAVKSTSGILNMRFIAGLVFELSWISSYNMKFNNSRLFSAVFIFIHCLSEAQLTFPQKLSFLQTEPFSVRLYNNGFFQLQQCYIFACVYFGSKETEDLILVNVDDGHIQTSWSEDVDLPPIPSAAAECFISRLYMQTPI